MCFISFNFMFYYIINFAHYIIVVRNHIILYIIPLTYLKTQHYVLYNRMATDTPTDTTERFTGRVKWFNGSTGYGFIKVIDGERNGDDVFAHHSGIVVSSEQYKYLVQGEYVSFILKESDGDKHEWQACDIHGIGGGPLMCETRAEIRAGAHAARETQAGFEHDQQWAGRGRGGGRGRGRSGGRGRGRYTGSRRVTYRGGGPREGEEWKLVRTNNQQDRHQNNNNDSAE